MNKRKKVVLIFIGSVGSGKGTQTKLLATKLNFPIISPGKLLRQEMEKKTEIGLKIEKRMDTGHLIDNHIVEAIIEKRLEKTDTKKGIIFDGFPRNIKQIASLKKWFNNFDKEQYNIWVVFIHITDKESRQRLSLRRSCPSCGQIFHLVYNPPKKKNTCDVCGHKLTNRPDDRPEVITDS